MRYEWFIAKRYLRPQGGATFIFHLTLISMCGVALGVASLITVMSVMNGFANDLRSKILQGQSHILLEYPEGEDSYREIMPQFQAVDNVSGISPVIMHWGILYPTGYRSNSQHFVQFVGIDPDLEPEESGLRKNIVAGSLEELRARLDTEKSTEKVKITDILAERRSNPEAPGIIIGKELAYAIYGILESDNETKAAAFSRILGQKLRMITVPSERETISEGITKAADFEIVGVFESGHFEFDYNWVYISLPTAQYLLGIGDSVTRFQIWLEDYSEGATRDEQGGVARFKEQADQGERDNLRAGGGVDVL